MRKIVILLAILVVLPMGAARAQSDASSSASDFATKAAPYVLGAAAGAVALPYLYPLAAGIAGTTLQSAAVVAAETAGSLYTVGQTAVLGLNAAITNLGPQAQVLVGGLAGGALAWWYNDAK